LQCKILENGGGDLSVTHSELLSGLSRLFGLFGLFRQEVVQPTQVHGSKGSWVQGSKPLRGSEKRGLPDSGVGIREEKRRKP